MDANNNPPKKLDFEKTLLYTALADKHGRMKPEAMLRLFSFLGYERAIKLPHVLKEAGLITPEDSERIETEIEILLSAQPVQEEAGDAGGKCSSRRYEENLEIGRGGLGRVVSAFDKSLERTIALKEMTEIPTAESVLRFIREAKITGQLEHPAIVPVHELGYRENGAPFYTMKLVKGRNLESALSSCTSLMKRLTFLPHMIDVANAIAYAHDKSIIHRDLKPENIMIGDYGETLVIDWGLAKMLQKSDANGASSSKLEVDATEQKPMTMKGTIMGTPHYMPPEQAQGSLENIDERADVFALGAILYRLIAGRPPYQGKGMKVVMQALEASPEPIHAIEPSAPEELVAICNKAMEKDIQDRYPTAKELAEDLRRYQNGLLVGAHQYSILALIWRWIKRHRAEVSVAFVATIILAALGVFSFINIKKERDTAKILEKEAVIAKKKAETERDLATERLTVALIEKGRLSEEIGKTNEAAILYASALASGEDPTARGGVVRALQKVRMAHESSWNMQSDPVVFSPDGKYIVVGGLDGKIRLLDTQKQDETRTLAAHDKGIFGLAFSPDGKLLASSADDAKVKLWEWPLNVDNPVVTLDGHIQLGGYASLPLAFSPDGRLLAYRGPGNTVIIWDIASKKIFKEISNFEAIALAFDQSGRYLTISSWGNYIYIWDLKKDIAEPLASAGKMSSRVIAKHPDGKRIAVSTGDSKILILEPANTKILATLSGHTDNIKPLNFSPDGKLLASGSLDGTVRIWDIDNYSLVDILPGMLPVINSVEFSPNGEHLVAADSKGKIILWRVLQSKNSNRLFENKGFWILSSVFSPDGEKLVTAGLDIKIWDLATNKEIKTYFWNPPGWAKIDISPDGQLLATGSSRGGHISLFSMSGERSSHINLFGLPEDHNVRGVAFNPNGSIVAGACGNAVGIWNVKEKKLVKKLVGPHRPHGLAFSPDGTLLASASKDSSVVLWETKKWEKVAVLPHHSESVVDVAFSSDGLSLASASLDGTIRIWNVSSQKQVGIFKEENLNQCYSVEFSPTSDERLGSACEKSVILWDVNEARSIAEIFRHEKTVENVSFSPDGKWIATASDDETARVINIERIETDAKQLLEDAKKICGCHVEGVKVVYH